MTDTSDPATVLAAGAVCWRPTAAGWDVLLVHRPKYDDWAFPKGKLEAGEILPQCAVREVWEETGHQVRLTQPLPCDQFTMPDGRTKLVHYWLARSLTSSKPSAPASEIDQTQWVSHTDAEKLLTYSNDRAIVHHVDHLIQTGAAATIPLVLSAHPVSPSSVAPSKPAGATPSHQAQLWGCWWPQLFVTTPYQCCVPYAESCAKLTGCTVKTKRGLGALDEHLLAEKTAKHLNKILTAATPAVISVHPSVMPSLMDSLRAVSDPLARAQLPARPPYLPVHELLVAHYRPQFDSPARIIAVERFHPTLI